MKHLSDARMLNEARLPLYAAASDEASVVVSLALISSETASLLPGYGLDALSAPLGAIGVPVLCEDLVPMSGAASFAGYTQPVGTFDKAVGVVEVSAVRSAVAARSFDAVAATSTEALNALSAAPSFHCMTRHLLESIRRAATLGPGQVERARAHGRDAAAAAVAWAFIEVQAVGLPEGAWLDETAAPIQAAGVDIICRDVPPIPPS